MSEINLLPWRQAQIDKKQKKQLACVMLFIFILSGFFLGAHCFLSKEAQISLAQKEDLEKQWESKQYVKSSGALSLAQASEIFAKARGSQKIFWQRISILSCLGAQHIPVTQMIYQKSHTVISGESRSVAELTQSLEECRVKAEKNTTIKKITFNPASKADLLSFQMIVI